MDLLHRASASFVKRVHLVMFLSFESKGLTLLSLRGHPQHQFVASFLAIRGGQEITMT